ncbi:class I SAM-dependent methyltransferase [Rhodococcus tibetensis]|uniref:Class I SAM-dependent methyltransferase n=1 Tax=Rhodococcus tibetensis TaxID=2965064 RepID=A0ABT1QE97_9NOCA|nr:class I SAM-dependent methyltransferase [Rhodococcus sp. FXJ9.536]MCQ4119472.1 class I SAM-dependent methyltransferase [Rhodococcus sp. FXJ9.536]
MVVPNIPARIRCAVDRLRVNPSDRILEVGCGPGVAVSLVAEKLVDGRITAIDRSDTAIARAEQRNDTYSGNRSVEFQNTELAGFRCADASFDKAFAVNVNVFWTRDATAEVRILWEALRPGGVLHLVYEGTESVHDEAKSQRIVDAVTQALRREGFEVDVDAGNALCITGVKPT